MTTAKDLIDVAENTVDGAICAIYLLSDDLGNDRYLIAYDGRSEILTDYVDVLERLSEKEYQL